MKVVFMATFIFLFINLKNNTIMGIKLIKKKITDGRVSLYLSICTNGKRKKEALGIILEKGHDRLTRDMNKIKLSIARSLQVRRELDYLLNKITDLDPILQQPSPPPEPVKGSDRDLLEIFSGYIDSYTKADLRILKASYNHLLEYSKANTLPLSGINKNFCKGFLDYLYQKFRGNTPSLYFKKFKNILNFCIDEGYIEKNPALSIHPTQRYALTKEILTPSEIEKLALTPCSNPQIKRAFLFSCHSGLRWCDIKQLKYENIDYSRNLLRITQQKVSSHSSSAVLFLNLNNSAMRIIGSQTSDKKGLIFTLPSHARALRIIKDWTQTAGINKHISFHCARHTFITMLIDNGAGIKTAASLAGHSSTRHTEKYIHVVDRQKQKAVDNLPDLPPEITF